MEKCVITGSEQKLFATTKKSSLVTWRSQRTKKIDQFVRKFGIQFYVF
jgi:hypothetical protein